MTDEREPVIRVAEQTDTYLSAAAFAIEHIAAAEGLAGQRPLLNPRTHRRFWPQSPNDRTPWRVTKGFRREHERKEDAAWTRTKFSSLVAAVMF